jgi:bacteriorhodopsin
MQAYIIMVLNETSFPLYCDGRQFEWLRYAAWATVAPLTVASLGNLAGAPSGNIVFAASASFIAVAGLFAGAVSPNCIAAWPLLAFAIVAGAVVAKELLLDFYFSATKFAAGRFASLYAFAAYFQLALWVGYAIVWGVSEGGKVTTATQEIITYTVLGILSKVVFVVVVLMARNAVVAHGSISAWLGGEELSISLSHSK